MVADLDSSEEEYDMTYTEFYRAKTFGGFSILIGITINRLINNFVQHIIVSNEY